MELQQNERVELDDLIRNLCTYDNERLALKYRYEDRARFRQVLGAEMRRRGKRP